MLINWQQLQPSQPIGLLNWKTSEDITKLIQNLDPNKAHGHDQISIHMLKICGKIICKPLECIFQANVYILSYLD